MAARKPTRVLVADDEPAARRRLMRPLTSADDLEVVGQARTDPEAVRAIEELRPDLAFLDVQMPGMSGIDVVREIGSDGMPLVIFVTVFDEYAVKAFDLVALEYLLKPFDDERFEQALNRARRQLARDSARKHAHSFS